MKIDLPKLELGPPRLKQETLQWSQEFLKYSTLSMRQKFFEKTGVRYSELHRLTYRDPVWDNPLGIMHNWLEGILQNHFRF